MNRDDTIERIREALGKRLLDFERKTSSRIFLEVAPDTVPDVSRLMFEEIEARLQTASGVDTRDAIEILYHWALDRLDCVVTVRTRLDRHNPEIESITPVCVAAEWVEREMWELLGIRFRNHPDLRHLLLDDDWPAGKFPLRRDYEEG